MMTNWSKRWVVYQWLFSEQHCSQESYIWCNQLELHILLVSVMFPILHVLCSTLFILLVYDLKLLVVCIFLGQYNDLRYWTTSEKQSSKLSPLSLTSVQYILPCSLAFQCLSYWFWKVVASPEDHAPTVRMLPRGRIALNRTLICIKLTRSVVISDHDWT